MKPILLIAANFLREHRWPVVMLFAWLILIALVVTNFGRSRPVPPDVAFYILQGAIFIWVFTTFFAANAIHGERKSKRILLVLSKAVSRADYMIAAALASCGLVVAYAITYGLCAMWVCKQALLPAEGVWSTVLIVIASSVLAATVALFFAAFTNPYLSIAATVLVFLGPGFFQLQGYSWSQWFPGFPLLLSLFQLQLSPRFHVDWRLLLLAVLQALLFCLAAAVLFNKRDIAVAVE